MPRILGYRLNSTEDLENTPMSSLPMRTLKDYFTDTTSAHGIPQWLRSRGAVKQIFWTMITFGAMGGLLFQLNNVFTTYFDYPISIDIKLFPSRGLRFPAVTICNMNPVKKSALESGTSALANLVLKDSQVPKDRKKRAITMSCKDPAQIHTPSGLCFGLGTYYLRVKYSGSTGARSICTDHYKGGLAIVNTQQKWTFLKENHLFLNISSPWYWIGIKNQRWFDQIPLNLSLFNAFAPGYPDPDRGECVVTDTRDGHRWKNARCDNLDDMYLPLCQQLVQCPWQVYRDNSTSPPTDLCYFLLDVALTMTYDQAVKACPRYDNEASLSVLDNQAKTEFVRRSGVFHQVTSGAYWMDLKDGKWEDKKDAEWTNWETGMQNMTGCGVGHIDKGLMWNQQDCSSHKALVLCQWRAARIPHVPHDPSTTATPTTTEQTTVEITSPIVTTAEITSEQVTTVAPTTHQPSTETPTTDAPSTIEPTTVPPTAEAPATPIPGHRPINGSIFPERIQLREEFKEEEEAIEVLATIPVEDKAEMGYKPDEFLLDCQYNGYVCSPTQDFVSFYNGIHGNCYVFNSGWNKSQPVRNSEKTGRRYGLKVVVDIGQDEYTAMFGENAGARIVIHPQDRMPFPEDEGILALPGKLTNIGLRHVRISRLPSPWGTCLEDGKKRDDDISSVYEELYPVKYSPNGCYKTCYQRNVIEECGCGDPYYPRQGLAFSNPGSSVPICNINNIKQDDCKYSVRQRYIMNELICNCPRNCVEEVFMPLVSTALWPSDPQVDFVRAAFRDKVPHLFNDANNSKKYSSNLLKLEIQYETLNFEKITEKKAYVEFRFMSDIGGTLGLFFGFSLITMFEIIEWFVDTMIVIFLRTFCKWNKRPGSRNSDKQMLQELNNRVIRLNLDDIDFNFFRHRQTRSDREVLGWLYRPSPPPSYHDHSRHYRFYNNQF